MISFFPLFVLLACCYAACQAGLTASGQALLVGLIELARRTAVRARLQSVSNAGLAAGAGLGALVLWADSRAAYLSAFALDAASFLAAALLVRGLREAAAPVPGGSERGRLAVLRDRVYALITLLNAVMCLNMPLLRLALPLWIAERTDASARMGAIVLT